MAGVGFRRSRDFTLFTFIGHNLLLVYYRRFEYKGNFCKYGLYYTWVQMLLQIGPLLRLGSNVITDGTFITLVPSTGFASCFRFPPFVTCVQESFQMFLAGDYSLVNMPRFVQVMY